MHHCGIYSAGGTCPENRFLALPAHFSSELKWFVHTLCLLHKAQAMNKAEQGIRGEGPRHEERQWLLLVNQQLPALWYMNVISNILIAAAATVGRNHRGHVTFFSYPCGQWDCPGKPFSVLSEGPLGCPPVGILCELSGDSEGTVSRWSSLSDRYPASLTVSASFLTFRSARLLKSQFTTELRWCLLCALVCWELQDLFPYWKLVLRTRVKRNVLRPSRKISPRFPYIHSQVNATCVNSF